MSRKLEKTDKTQNAAHQRNMLETAKGGGFLAAGQIFAFGSRFVIAFLVARQLGASDYGIYNLSISAATIIASIATLGLDSTMVRYIAIQSNDRDEEAIWGTIQIGTVFSVLASILLSVALYFLAEPIAINFFNEPALTTYLQLFSLFIPFATLSSVLVDVTRGFKRMDYSALAEYVILFIARVILVLIILVLFDLNAYTAIIAYGLSDVVVSVSLVYFVNKTFGMRRPVRRALYQSRRWLYNVNVWPTQF